MIFQAIAIGYKTFWRPASGPISTTATLKFAIAEYWRMARVRRADGANLDLLATFRVD
jgi:hypothetical protein